MWKYRVWGLKQFEKCPVFLFTLFQAIRGMSFSGVVKIQITIKADVLLCQPPVAIH